MKKKILLVSFLVLVFPCFVLSAERASEDEMFGGASALSTPTPVASKDASPANGGADSWGLDTTKPHPDKTTGEEAIQIGGTLSSEADYYIQHGVPLSNDMVTNPNILFLYLDSKLESDSRVFARIRTFYDPTGLTGGNLNTVSFTNPYGISNGNSDNLQTSLQELRISANIGEKVFFTLGRQKVKYGAAKFFNPTDFLNQQQFNFFLPSDERPGVDMVKVHVPSGTSNFYAAGLTGNPSTGTPGGGYFRGEFGYDGIGSFLGGGEISLSGYLPRSQPGKAGLDISQAVGDFDVYFEGAAGQDSGGNWKDAVSAGAGWSFRYDDRANNTVALDGEYFQAGALAEFGILSISLPEPGSLKDVTFVETNLFSFIDQSGLSRLDTIYQFTTQLSGRVYVSGHWGQLGGSLYLPGQVAELGSRLDMNF